MKILSSCRLCGTPLQHSFCDLGSAPLSNAFLREQDLEQAESHYPLHVRLCTTCLLVQLPAFSTPDEIFGDYAYFSSYSDSWLAHAKAYVELMQRRFGLDAGSRVIEIASNDGYLLQYFTAVGVPVLGVEPAANVAAVAQSRGIPTRVEFFGTESAKALAAEGMQADLLLGNNVLAHVPNLNDFIAGLALTLKPGGVITMEFPHLLRLIEGVQFDTIYHEHFSYFSLHVVERAFATHGLALFDAEQIPTHGGSLRIYARHVGTEEPSSAGLDAIRSKEKLAGLDSIEAYEGFAERTREVKRSLLQFLIGARRAGKRIAAYGAAAKGNTLLNYCGVRNDFLDYVVDLNPHKQGRYLPGSRLPVHAPEMLKQTRPDYVLILPWNLREEVIAQHAYVRDWGGRFVVPIPAVKVIA